MHENNNCSRAIRNINSHYICTARRYFERDGENMHYCQRHTSSDLVVQKPANKRNHQYIIVRCLTGENFGYRAPSTRLLRIVKSGGGEFVKLVHLVVVRCEITFVGIENLCIVCLQIITLVFCVRFTRYFSWRALKGVG